MNTGEIIAAVGAGAVALGLGGYMMGYEQFNVQVRELELSFPNLPKAFDGYTILHLSDLHLRKLGKLEKRTMELVSQREVDCCMITGDVTKEPRASDIFRRVCLAIPHKDPIYFVLGNSEHKPWLDTDMLVQALTFEGLNLLVNSSTELLRDGEKIVIVGVDDAYSKLADVDAAFSGVDPDDFIIFLTHCPSTTPKAIKKGADLALSGHTHGGQVRLPGIGLIWSHMRANRFLNDGLYLGKDLSRHLGFDVGHRVLFVNRGVGTSRVHIRLLCPPEIVYIVLRRA